MHLTNIFVKVITSKTTNYCKAMARCAGKEYILIVCVIIIAFVVCNMFRAVCIQIIKT